MRRIRLSSLAEADIAGILRWTEGEFGASARFRYEALIAAALRDLAEDPYRPGARERPEIGEGLMSYHLRFSRRQVAEATGRVRRPAASAAVSGAWGFAVGHRPRVAGAPTPSAVGGAGPPPDRIAPRLLGSGAARATG